MSDPNMPVSLKGMAARIERDPGFREQFLSDPQATLEEAAGYIPNTSIYRWVVGSLGAALILCLVSSVVILLFGSGPAGEMPQVPDIFVTASSTIIGALAGLLLPQS